MQFIENFLPLLMENFQNHYKLVFDLTSFQDAAEQLHYPEISRETLRLEMFFQFPLNKILDKNQAPNAYESVQSFCFPHPNKCLSSFTNFLKFESDSTYSLFCVDMLVD